MKLNWVEKTLMNNPLRAASQRLYEARLLEKLGGKLGGGRALEIGCGRGVGIDIILGRFGAGGVRAFDLDPDMVERARRRVAKYGDRVELHIGDATDIGGPDGHYDAVFDFGIIHHVPDWQRAVTEVARVLAPGGRFYFEEVTAHALQRPTYRKLFDHPEDNRFGATEFVSELERNGIDVNGNYVERFFGDFVIGVGRRRED